MARQDKKRKKHPLWRTLLLAFVSVVLGVNLYLWNAASLMGNALPMPFGYGMAVVLSGSMEPTLSVDDLVLIRETDEISEGDIIVFQSGQELIIHRVIAIDGDCLQTQGDANNVMDPPILLSAVKGKLVGRVPLAGKAVRVLKKPAVVIGLLAAAFLLMELSYRSTRQKDAEEIEQIKEEIRRLKEEQADR